MVNRSLPTGEVSESLVFSAIFRLSERAGETPDDSNFTEIFEAFESPST